MISIPTEILGLIFSHVTNSQDQLILQQVCHYWHVPAKRAFYEKIVIAEVHDEANYIYNYNKTSTFINFISSMVNSIKGPIQIPPPGRYVKKLFIHFDIALEPKFMPTVSDYQLLATACPNIEEFDFPSTMIWNHLIFANINQYWKKMRRVTAFRITPMMNSYQLDRFLHFKSSLTTLEINYYYTNHQEEQFKQMIRLFTNLEYLKITTGTQSFTRIIPIITECCPNLIEFNMDTTTCLVNDVQTSVVVPRLYQLHLNVRIMSTYIINAIIRNFPDLQKLVLHMQQSSVGLEHLITFITSRLSQSSIHLFISSNDFTTSIEQFILAARPIVNITYDSRSSFTTGIPDLSFEHHYQHKELFVRYQGSISPRIVSKDLPHMQLIKEHGFFIKQLKIQSPSSLLTSEKSNVGQQVDEESCIQSIIMEHCPNLSMLNVSMCYFDLKEAIAAQTQTQPLERLILEKSFVISTSLTHLSRACHQLKYMELNECDFDDNTIDMSETTFKRLSLITPCDNAKILLHEIGNDCTTNYYYSRKSRELLTAKQMEDIAITTRISIRCYSMDQFRFNHIPLYK